MTFFNRKTVFAALLASICSSGALAVAGSPAPVGVISSPRGEVFVDNAPAKAGSPIFATSKIRTGNGKTAVLLAGESVIQLGFDSELEIKSVLMSPEKGLNSEVELNYGKVRTLVRNTGAPKRFDIRTKTAVMGVRGTEVLVDSPKGSATPFFATVEGTAQLTLLHSGAPSGIPIPMPQNQAFGGSAGGQQTLSSQQARAMASSVAPPRGETFTVSEVKSSATNGTEGSRPASPQAPTSTAPKLDPVADSAIVTGGAPAAAGGSAVIVPASKKL